MRLDPVLLKALPGPSHSVLDIGCGHGHLVRALKQRGYGLVTGVDKVARWGDGDAQDCIISDVTDETGFFAWNDFLYHCIIMWDVLEHIKRSDVLTLLRRCRDTLTDDGTLILHLPNAEALFGSRILHSDLTHRWAYTPQLIVQLLNKAGFPHVQCYECRPIVHGPLSFIRYCAWFVISAIARFVLAVETGRYNGVMSQNFICIATKEVPHDTLSTGSDDGTGAECDDGGRAVL